DGHRRRGRRPDRAPGVTLPAGTRPARAGSRTRPQVTTRPVGAAPAGPGVGEEESSVSVPPLTENPLILSDPASTTQTGEPSGDSRASSAPRGEPLSGVLPRRVSDPSAAIE